VGDPGAGDAKEGDAGGAGDAMLCGMGVSCVIEGDAKKQADAKVAHLIFRVPSLSSP
jgi:hypothetical protein